MDYEIVDIRLKTIFNNISNSNVKRASRVINNTIYTLNNAVDNHCPKPFLNKAVETLYRVLVSLAMKRSGEAMLMLRDLHYHIVDLTTPEQSEDEIEFDM
jgi:hypothetical protein